MLDTTPAAVNSALQRARKAVDERVPGPSQQDKWRLGPDGRRELVDAFVAAWERADVDALLELLAEDARFTMPPLPAWFDGRPTSTGSSPSACSPPRGGCADLGQRPARLRLLPGRRAGGGPFRLGAINVVSVRGGRIAEITGFIDPALHRSSASSGSDEFRAPGVSQPVKGGSNHAQDHREQHHVAGRILHGPGATSWPCRWTRRSTPTTPSGSAPPTRCCSAATATWGSAATGRRGRRPRRPARPPGDRPARQRDRQGRRLRQPTADETDPWRSTTIVRRADADDQVAELKRQPGGTS